LDKCFPIVGALYARPGMSSTLQVSLNGFVQMLARACLIARPT
jgi:hypothetical protein